MRSGNREVGDSSSPLGTIFKVEAMPGNGMLLLFSNFVYIVFRGQSLSF